MIEKVATIGGLFAILTFVHFFVDFVCQTHFEAINKHNNWKIRARHCLIYSIGFVPILLIFNMSLLRLAICLNVLFWSHFVEDSYVPVFLWAKYIRKPQEMQDLESKQGFIKFIGTPLGKILMIAIDQIIHLTFLFPVIYLILK